MSTNILVSPCSTLFTVSIWGHLQRKGIHIQNVVTLATTWKILPVLHRGFSNNYNISNMDCKGIVILNKKITLFQCFEISKNLKVYFICFHQFYFFLICKCGRHCFLFSSICGPHPPSAVIFLAGCPAKEYIPRSTCSYVWSNDQVLAIGMWAKVTHAASTEWP